MKKVTIREIEPQLAQKLDVPWKNILQDLNYPVPEGYRVRISLRSAKGRKKPGNIAAGNWLPLSSERAEIWLEPCTFKGGCDGSSRNMSEGLSGSSPTNQGVGIGAGAAINVHPAEVELLRALDRAESTPGWNFVALKKFRDEILPSENLPSIHSDVERQSVLRSVIEKRLVVTKPVPNPKSPQFPVTSIRVNRLLPEVQAVLGLPKRDLSFHPIQIKGEPLSSVILRERR